MKQTIAKEATEVARDYISLFLAGMGISLAPFEYFGGLFLALAAASIMSRHRNDTRKVWIMILTAFVFATMVSITWSSFEFTFPVQIAMAAAGFGSKWGVNIMTGFFDRIEFRVDNITDRLVDKALGKDNKITGDQKGDPYKDPYDREEDEWK